MLRNRSSLTEVKITILGKSFRQSSRKSKSPGRVIWLTAFEIKVPSRSRAKTFTFISDSNISAPSAIGLAIAVNKSAWFQNAFDWFRRPRLFQYEKVVQLQGDDKSQCGFS